MQRVSIATIHDRRALVLLLLGGVLAAALLYVFLLAATFSHLSAKQDAARELATVRASIAVLESRYLAASERVDPSLIGQRGLVTPSEVHYVTRKPLGRVFGAQSEI